MAAKPKAAGTAVAPAPQKALVRGIEVADEAMLREIEGVVGAGVSTNPDDSGLPFLYIAQANSKALKKQLPEYIEGLEVGNAYNTATLEMFDAEKDGVLFTPCFFKAVYNEWTPVDSGGGFHGQHPLDTPLLNGANPKLGADGNPRRDTFDLDNGHELVLTHEYWGVLPENWEACIVAMSSSNLGASKKIQNLLKPKKIQLPSGQFVPKPAFFTNLRLKTAFEKNDSGDWYKWVLAGSEPNEDPEYRAYCKALARECIEGRKKASAPPGQGESAGSAEVPV